LSPRRAASVAAAREHRPTGSGDALLGAAIIGVTAAIIASNDRPVYDSYPAYRT
jgi:hypothetical protein